MVTHKVLIAVLLVVLTPMFWGPTVSDLIKAHRHASCEKSQTSKVQAPEGEQSPSVLERLLD